VFSLNKWVNTSTESSGERRGQKNNYKRDKKAGVRKITPSGPFRRQGRAAQQSERKSNYAELPYGVLNSAEKPKKVGRCVLVPSAIERRKKKRSAGRWSDNAKKKAGEGKEKKNTHFDGTYGSMPRGGTAGKKGWDGGGGEKSGERVRGKIGGG